MLVLFAVSSILKQRLQFFMFCYRNVSFLYDSSDMRFDKVKVSFDSDDVICGFITENVPFDVDCICMHLNSKHVFRS